jgi:hypothetical protein
MPPVVVNITSLTRAAVEYDNLLRTLPYLTLEEVVSTFKFNMKELAHKHILTSFERKAGVMKPYGATVTEDEEQEIGKLKESTLELEMAYCSIFDKITNYKEVKVLSNAGEKIDNKTKKHPLEQHVLETIVRTWGEDVVDALFPGERDESNASPLGAFDGFDTKCAALVVAGEVSVAKGNLIQTGAIATPVDGDTDALDAIVAWFRQFDPKLRNVPKLWYVPDAVLLPVLMALDNKMTNRKVIGVQDLLDYLNVHALVRNLTIANHPCMGTGQKMYVTIPGNFDIGVNTNTDGQFVQVRSIKTDPNIVQFWIQAEYGTRINLWNKKVFVTNELAAVANQLSGDYNS